MKHSALPVVYTSESVNLDGKDRHFRYGIAGLLLLK